MVRIETMKKPVDLNRFRHLYPFTSRYYKNNGLQYHYLDEGYGEPVVMLHGNPTWSFFYRNMVNALSGEYRTIVPDHIGCGLSEKPGLDRYDYRLKSRVNDLDRLLIHLDIQEGITLMVHDWGGMIGMVYALRHPERIRRLIITNTAGFFPPKQKGLPFRLWLIRYMTPFAVPAVLCGNLFAAAAVHMAPCTKLPPDVRTGLTAPYNCPGNRIATLKFVQDIPLCREDPSYGLVRYADENLTNLRRIPMLILWGRRDFVFDTDYYHEWRRRFPRAEAHFFEDAGHYLLEDKPNEIASYVKDFLKKHPA